MQLITFGSRPFENQDSKLDFMTSRDSFMYIYPAVIIISVIKSKSGSKSAEKVCKRNVNIYSVPYSDSKNHDFSLCNISGLRGVMQMGLGPKVRSQRN